MKTNRPKTVVKLYILIGVSLASLVLVYIYYLFVIGNGRSGLEILNLELLNSKYQWKPEYGKLNGPDIDPKDSRVILNLRRNFLSPPSTLPYKLDDEFNDPSMGQSDIIKSVFKDLKSPNSERFFIECGALDGETRSNTLYFEKVWGWQGLLIEGDPVNYKKIETKHRKAWTSNSCLSTSSFPKMVSFEQAGNIGKISSFNVGHAEPGYTDVQCFPLESYLIALNISIIDYFSLDVEGSELDILRTIPWDKFTIRTLSVEFIHDVEGKEAIKEFMKGKGYFVQAEVTNPGWLANDFIFIKKSFFNSLPIEIKEDLIKQREIEKHNIVF